MILIIAGATCREAVRSKAFLGLLVFFVVGVLFARIIGWVSATDGNEVTSDLVLSLQSVVGVLVAVATGTALVHTEVKQHTLYTVLSRPLPRWKFVVGKYIGLAAALAIGQVAMLVIGLAWLWLTGAPVHGWLALAGLLTTAEVLLMAAAALCWTALSSPLLATALGLATYALGHAVAALPGLMYHLEGWQRTVVTVLAALVPNLGEFAYRNEAVHAVAAQGLRLTAGDVAGRLAYGGLWIALLVTVTVSVYRRKQL